jgi:hypothetical protein
MDGHLEVDQLVAARAGWSFAVLHGIRELASAARAGTTANLDLGDGPAAVEHLEKRGGPPHPSPLILSSGGPRPYL